MNILIWRVLNLALYSPLTCAVATHITPGLFYLHLGSILPSQSDSYTYWGMNLLWNLHAIHQSIKGKQIKQCHL